MMKKGIVCLLSTVAINAAAQNQVQQFYMNNSLSNQAYVQQRANPVMASNVMSVKKPSTTNTANKPKVVQTVQRRPVQQAAQRNINPPVQIKNNDIQIQMNITDNNVGNEFNNFEVIQIQQISNVALPQIQLDGSAGMEMRLPKVNVKLGSVKQIKNSSHKSSQRFFHVKNKCKKLNRKWCTKLDNGRKLRLKVDNCFRW